LYNEKHTRGIVIYVTVFFVHSSFAAVYPPQQLICKKVDDKFSCDGLDSYYFNVSFYQIDNPNTPVVYTLNKHGHKQGWYWSIEKWGEFLYENSSSQFLYIHTQPGIIMDASDTNWKKNPSFPPARTGNISVTE